MFQTNEILNIKENLKIVGGVATGKTATLKELAIKLDNVMVLDFIGEYEVLKESFEGDKLDVINLCNPDCPKVKLSKEIIDLAKQYDFVIIDETSYLFAEEVNGFYYFYSPSRTRKPIAFRHGMKVRLDTECNKKPQGLWHFKYPKCWYVIFPPFSL
jgi:hypothetical protein